MAAAFTCLPGVTNSPGWVRYIVRQHDNGAIDHGQSLLSTKRSPHPHRDLIDARVSVPSLVFGTSNCCWSEPTWWPCVALSNDLQAPRAPASPGEPAHGRSAMSHRARTARFRHDTISAMTTAQPRADQEDSLTAHAFAKQSGVPQSLSPCSSRRPKHPPARPTAAITCRSPALSRTWQTVPPRR